MRREEQTAERVTQEKEYDDYRRQAIEIIRRILRANQEPESSLSYENPEPRDW